MSGKTGHPPLPRENSIFFAIRSTAEREDVIQTDQVVLHPDIAQMGNGR